MFVFDVARGFLQHSFNYTFTEIIVTDKSFLFGGWDMLIYPTVDTCDLRTSRMRSCPWSLLVRLIIIPVWGIFFCSAPVSMHFGFHMVVLIDQWCGASCSAQCSLQQSVDGIHTIELGPDVLMIWVFVERWTWFGRWMLVVDGADVEGCHFDA